MCRSQSQIGPKKGATKSNSSTRMAKDEKSLREVCQRMLVMPAGENNIPLMSVESSEFK